MAGAMTRIAELEAALQRSGAAGARGAALPDDTRAVIRDAKSTHRRTPRMSPRAGARSPGSDALEPLPGGGSGGVAGAAKEALAGSGGDKLAAVNEGCSSGGGSSGGKIGTAVYLGGGGGGAPERASAELLAAAGVQALSAAQVAAIVRGAAPSRVGGYEVFAGAFRGTPCHAWRLTLAQPVNLLELRRACGRFCCAHPNVSALLATCVEPLDAAQPMDEDGDAAAGTSSGGGGGMSAAAAAAVAGRDGAPVLEGGCHLWVVEERHGDTSLAARLERGLLSWQHALAVAADVGSALAYLQTLHRLAPGAGLDDGGFGCDSPALSAPLSPLAVAHMLAPPGVRVAAASGAAKLSLVPAMLAQLEFSLGVAPGEARISEAREQLLPYVHPSQMFGGGCGAAGDAAFDATYGFAVVLLQLLTEQQALGLLGTVRLALSGGTLMNLVPRTPAAGQDAVALAEDFARLALRAADAAGALAAPAASDGDASMAEAGAAAAAAAAGGSSSGGGGASLEGDLLPGLAALRARLEALGPAAVSWEAVEELLLVPLAAPGAPLEPCARRWVRQDFKVRRRLFMEEAAKLAAEGPIHKIEVRRSRCFKDSVTTFAGKGLNVWRQPLKVAFVGEAGMDSGGVTREWFSCICAALSRGSLDLFWAGGPAANQLYVNPLSSSPSHLKRFHFVGMFMAKALLESSARAKELGPISLNLRFCEPFWKLLLGIPLSLMDLQALDPVEFRSLLQILQLDIDGLIFETFAWNFQHVRRGGGAADGANGGGGSAAARDEPEVPSVPTGASPFSGDSAQRVEASIPLKPGGAHVRVTNANKREYVLLKAQKMLMGAVEAQMSAVIDAFHALVPRELVEKYAFTPLEMQLLVCGEQVRRR